MTKTYTHFINGEHFTGSSNRFGDVYNPTLGEVSAQVPFANRDDVDKALAAAEAAFPAWAATSVLQRSRIMARYTQLLYEHQPELAELVSSEHGKVFEDAMGSVLRGIEVAEFASGIPQLQKG